MLSRILLLNYNIKLLSLLSILSSLHQFLILPKVPEFLLLEISQLFSQRMRLFLWESDVRKLSGWQLQCLYLSMFGLSFEGGVQQLSGGGALSREMCDCMSRYDLSG